MSTRSKARFAAVTSAADPSAANTSAADPVSTFKPSHSQSASPANSAEETGTQCVNTTPPKSVHREMSSSLSPEVVSAARALLALRDEFEEVYALSELAEGGSLPTATDSETEDDDDADATELACTDTEDGPNGERPDAATCDSKHYAKIPFGSIMPTVEERQALAREAADNRHFRRFMRHREPFAQFFAVLRGEMSKAEFRSFTEVVPCGKAERKRKSKPEPKVKVPAVKVMKPPQRKRQILRLRGPKSPPPAAPATPV